MKLALVLLWLCVPVFVAGVGLAVYAAYFQWKWIRKMNEQTRPLDILCEALSEGEKLGIPTRMIKWLCRLSGERREGLNRILEGAAMFLGKNPKEWLQSEDTVRGFAIGVRLALSSPGELEAEELDD